MSSRGFSIRLKAGAAITTTGETDVKILDLLAAAEKKHGEGVWKLELVKEAFAPWHPPIEEDALGIELATTQIFAGVFSGKFTLKDEEDYVQFLAIRYYVQFGEMDSETLKDFMATAIPKRMITGAVSAKKGKKAAAASKTGKSVDEWCTLTEKAHARSKVVRANEPVDKVRKDLIDRFLVEWPHFFITCFSATKGPGPAIKGSSDIVNIAFNACGIFILEGEHKVLKQWGYDSIDEVKADVNGDFIIKTLADEVKRQDASQYSFKPVFQVEIASFAAQITRMKNADAAPVKL